MAVIPHVVLAGVTREQYDTVRKECGWLDEAPAGGIAHLSWWEGPTTTTWTPGTARKCSHASVRTGSGRPWHGSA